MRGVHSKAAVISKSRFLNHENSAERGQWKSSKTWLS